MSAGNVPSEGTDSEGAALPELTDALDTNAESLPSPELTTGQKLRAAREERGLTIERVAQLLKLSAHQVAALEADDWESLHCNTIMRGFVRNYARLLNLDSAAMMLALDRLNMPKSPELEISQGTNVKVPQDGGVQRRDFFSVIAGFTVLLLAVLVYFFMPDALWQSALSMLKSSPPSAEVASSQKANAESGQQKEAVAMALPSAIVLKDEPAPASQSNQPAAPVPAQAATVAGVPPKTGVVAIPAAADTKTVSGSGLKMSFKQPSWVEVRDRTGEIVFSQLCQPDTQREVEGKPPFAMVIGNATHVTVHYKGKPVDLSKRSKDDVARVTVE